MGCGTSTEVEPSTPPEFGGNKNITKYPKPIGVSKYFSIYR